MNPSQPSFEPIAIIGMSCLFPGAQNLREYWANIKNKVDAISEIPSTHWRPEDYFDADQKRPDFTYSRFGGFLKPIDFYPGEHGISPANLEAIDASQILSLVVAHGALADSGYDARKMFDRDRASVVLGVTGTLQLVIPLGARLGHPFWRKAMEKAGVAADIANEVVANISEAYVPWQENSFPGLLGNVVAGRVANRLNFGGTNCVVDAACGSSLSAMNLAVLELAARRCDMVVTGGVDTFNDIFMYMCFSKTPALSPTGHARPFSADCDGTTLGEGIGMVVLKRLSDAQAAGDRVYAIIRGVGTSSDGKGKAIYAPSSQGQMKALRRAYEQAGVTPRQISLLEAHGTGTKVGDQIEISALREIYTTSENGRPWCGIGSVKSMIGHTKAAAGVAGIIKVALSLWHKVMPPTLKIAKPAPGVLDNNSPFFLVGERHPWFSAGFQPRRAAVSSFGFGGSNYHVVLEEGNSRKQTPDWDSTHELFAFSGDSPAAIKAALAPLSSLKSEDEIRQQAALSRRGFQASQACRLTLLLEWGKTDLAKLVQSVSAKLGETGQTSFSLPEGAWYGSGSVNGKMAWVFPGQGAQYPHMGRDLAILSPEMFATISEAGVLLGDMDDQSRTLTECLYPPSWFVPEAAKADEERLKKTLVAQPAIGAVSLGMAALLQTWGLRPEGTVGHSFGELTALCVAGAFPSDAFFRMARKRGELMGQGDGDRGGMLAVSASAAEVGQALKQAGLDLVVANHNAPDQVVISGRKDLLEKARELFQACKWRSTMLQVAAAFHSPLVADAATPFREALENISWQQPGIPVYANSTAEPYPTEAQSARDLLGSQLARPVRFVDSIERMYADGFRTFVEVGPGGRMSGLVKSILANRPASILALDASSGRKSGVGDLGRMLAQLAALGYNISLTGWQDGEAWLEQQAREKHTGLSIKMNGANYRSPRPERPARPRPVSAPAPVAVAQTSASPAPAQGLAATIPAAQPVPRIIPMSQGLTPMNQVPGNSLPMGTQPNSDESVRLARETLSALQQIQLQTADLHRRFLEGQESAARTIQTLIERQISSGGALNTQPVSLQTVPAAPAPAVYAPAPALPAAPAAITPVAPMAARPPQPASATSPAPAVSSAPQAASASNQQVQTTLMSVVSEKTGYPVEMLNLDMDMESDLGIDSIKRVEIMSGFQEKMPGAPVVQPGDLGKFRTLRQILEFLGLAGASTPAPVATAPAFASAPSMAASSASQAGSASGQQVQTILMQVVSEKTGYPVEMLNLDMDMESDLGIDSIKRVEIMSGFQEKMPGAPVVQPGDLGKFRTLRQIIEFLGASSVASTPAATASVTATPATLTGTADPVDAGAGHSVIEQTLLQVVSEKTGYPIEMLNPDMDMEADLGIDSIKRVEILSGFQERVPSAPVVQPGDLGKFRSLGQILTYLKGAAPNTASAASAQSASASQPAHSAATVATAPIAAASEKVLRRVVLHVEEGGTTERPFVKLPAGGVIALTDDGSPLTNLLAKAIEAKGYRAVVLPLDDSNPGVVSDQACGLVLLAPGSGKPGTAIWPAASEEALKKAFFLAQRFAPGLTAHAEQGALLVTVSRLDGAFGLKRAGRDLDPVWGGLAGLAKTAAREWPEVSVKAVDLDRTLKPEEACDALISELFQVGPMEIGIQSGKHWVPVEREVAIAPETPVQSPLQAGDVVIITGGARGVTAEVARALAETWKPTLVLCGRSSLPGEEPAWLRGVDGEKPLKEAILAQARREGRQLLPKDLEAQYQKLSGEREIFATLHQIRQLGVNVSYKSLDVRREDDVRRVLNEIRTGVGPIRGLIHGAGVLRDRRILEKNRDQFDAVFDTKVAGLRNLLQVLANDDLRVVALFSSVTGRYGRIGQVDYSMANEVLNKAAQKLAATRPECRVVSFNWGPWEGGMVTPSLRKVFHEEGVGLIPLREGGRFFVRELGAGGREEVEIVVGESLPVSAPPVKASPAVSTESILAVAQTGMALPPNTSGKRFLAAFEHQLSLSRDHFLNHHIMNGDPVLPTAVIIELLAHGALHENPGFHFHGFNQLRILRGVVMHGRSEYTLRVWATKVRGNEDQPSVHVELRGGPRDREVVHASTEVILAAKLPAEPKSRVAPDISRSFPQTIKEVYQHSLFHGPLLEGIAAIDGWSEEGIVTRLRAAPAPETWMEQPLRPSWLSDPLVLDAAFQVMILWTIQQFGSPSLPSAGGSYRQYRERFPLDGVVLKVATRKSGPHTVKADFEFLDQHGRLIARLDGYECVMNPALSEAFRRRSIEGTASA